jgi:hypothetical protein
MKGKVEISVTLFFELDLDDEEIQDVIADMDYEFKHLAIQETRINGIIEE